MAEDIRDRAAGALLALIPIYYKNVMRNKHAITGVEMAQFHTLKLILKFGALPMSEIGDRLYISRPYMTRLADLMIADRLVERRPDATDRRVIHLAITEEGRKHLKRAISAYTKDLLEGLAGLDDRDIEKLSGALEDVHRILVKLQQE